MCFGALTITNLGVENLNHYKKSILEIHSSEVRGRSHLPGDGTGVLEVLSGQGQRKGEGLNPLFSPRPGSGGWCLTSST